MKTTAQAAQPAVFTFNDTHPIRIEADSDGTLWFCAKDVCTVLGYANDTDALKKHCREAGVAKRYLRSGGQRRALAFIDEGNLYRLILKSRLPAAQRFEAWVCDEVLPAIRKTGHYVASAASGNAPRGAEALTANDLANLRRLVWMVSSINMYEGCWTRATWKAIRASTHSRHKSELLVDHLPLIGQELRAVGHAALVARTMTDAINTAALQHIEAGRPLDNIGPALAAAAAKAKPMEWGRWEERELGRLLGRAPASLPHLEHAEP